MSPMAYAMSPMAYVMSPMAYAMSHVAYAGGCILDGRGRCYGAAR